VHYYKYLLLKRFCVCRDGGQKEADAEQK